LLIVVGKIFLVTQVHKLSQPRNNVLGILAALLIRQHLILIPNSLNLLHELDHVLSVLHLVLLLHRREFQNVSQTRHIVAACISMDSLFLGLVSLKKRELFDLRFLLFFLFLFHRLLRLHEVAETWRNIFWFVFALLLLVEGDAPTHQLL